MIRGNVLSDYKFALALTFGISVGEEAVPRHFAA